MIHKLFSSYSYSITPSSLCSFINLFSLLYTYSVCSNGIKYISVIVFFSEVSNFNVTSDISSIFFISIVLKICKSSVLEYVIESNDLILPVSISLQPISNNAVGSAILFCNGLFLFINNKNFL